RPARVSPEAPPHAERRLPVARRFGRRRLPLRQPLRAGRTLSERRSGGGEGARPEGEPRAGTALGPLPAGERAQLHLQPGAPHARARADAVGHADLDVLDCGDARPPLPPAAARPVVGSAAERPDRRHLGAGPHFSPRTGLRQSRRPDRFHRVRAPDFEDHARRMDRRAAVPPLLRQGRTVEDRGGSARPDRALHHRRRPGLPRVAESPHRRVARRRRAATGNAVRAGRRQPRAAAREHRCSVSHHGPRSRDNPMTRCSATFSSVTPFLVTVLGVGCGGDRSRSPTCGLALLVGPRMIQQQLAILPFVLTDAPRGLSASLPALVAGTSHQGEVSVAYEGPRLALTYQGPSFPPFPTDSAVYGLLVVDDSTQRAQGVLIYESVRPPPSFPQLGTVRGGGGGPDKTIPLYGVRVDWPSVSNPRCPLLGPPAQAPR